MGGWSSHPNRRGFECFGEGFVALAKKCLNFLGASSFSL